jgi:GNAT superfamily N-acetyltransferase
MKHRLAATSDLPAIASLYHAVWHETHSAFMPAEEIARRTPPFFVERMTALLPSTLVAESGGRIAGFASWRGHLLGQIYVAAPFRGSSIAVALMAACERAMANEAITEAELHCVVGNHRARRFYERAGWKHDGEVIEMVAGPDGDAAIAFWRMRKMLGGASIAASSVDRT